MKNPFRTEPVIVERVVTVVESLTPLECFARLREALNSNEVARHVLGELERHVRDLPTSNQR